MQRILPLLMFGLFAHPTLAGDAVALGYNYDGVWTAVTYFRSSTPKAGHHYWNAQQACVFAQRDLHRRAGQDLARTQIIGQSDRTGYVAIARAGKPDANTDVTTIGRGKSQKEADESAVKKLNERNATTNEKIVYRYFSYGVDSKTSVSTNHGDRQVR